MQTARGRYQLLRSERGKRDGPAGVQHLDQAGRDTVIHPADDARHRGSDDGGHAGPGASLVEDVGCRVCRRVLGLGVGKSCH